MIVEFLITLLLGEILITKLKRNYINGNMIIFATFNTYAIAMVLQPKMVIYQLNWLAFANGFWFEHQHLKARLIMSKHYNESIASLGTIWSITIISFLDCKWT
jgi:hypothetical protein